jgi:hypothetical protein
MKRHVFAALAVLLLVIFSAPATSEGQCNLNENCSDCQFVWLGSLNSPWCTPSGCCEAVFDCTWGWCYDNSCCMLAGPEQSEAGPGSPSASKGHSKQQRPACAGDSKGLSTMVNAAAGKGGITQ